MASTTHLNLFNRFSLQGFNTTNSLVRSNVLMHFPGVKNEDIGVAPLCTIYSLLLQLKLTQSTSMNEIVYTVDYSKQLNYDGTVVSSQDIVCAYIDTSRSVIVSPEFSYPFGAPTTAGEIVTGNTEFIKNYIAIVTKGDWSRYTAMIVLNLVIKDKKFQQHVQYPQFPLTYKDFVV